VAGRHLLDVGGEDWSDARGSSGGGRRRQRGFVGADDDIDGRRQAKLQSGVVGVDLHRDVEDPDPRAALGRVLLQPRRRPDPVNFSRKDSARVGGEPDLGGVSDPDFGDVDLVDLRRGTHGRHVEQIDEWLPGDRNHPRLDLVPRLSSECLGVDDETIPGRAEHCLLESLLGYLDPGLGLLDARPFPIRVGLGRLEQRRQRGLSPLQSIPGLLEAPLGLLEILREGARHDPLERELGRLEARRGRRVPGLRRFENGSRDEALLDELEQNLPPLVGILEGELRFLQLYLRGLELLPERLLLELLEVELGEPDFWSCWRSSAS